MDGFPIDLVVYFGGAVLAIIALITWVARKPLLAVSPAPPDAVLRDLAYRLRAAGHTVREEASRLVVRIDALSAVKIHARAGPRGTEVRYEVDATGLGWTLVIIFAGIGYLGVVAFVVALVIHATASRFARGRVAPLIALSPLGAPPPMDARALLLEGLSEAQRLVSEAVEYEREARQNATGLILLGSMALWTALVFALAFYVPGLGANAIPWAVAIASAVAGITAVSGVCLVLRRGAGRLGELEREESLFRGALLAESTGVPVPGTPRVGLELLLRAAERSVFWREVRRRRKLWHDPVAGFTIFLFAWGAVITTALAAGLDILPLAMRVGLGLLGFGFAAGTAWSVRSWRRQVREEDERDRRDWDERRRRIESELLGILSG